MAVMNKMRENMHIILFFLLIMFLGSMTIGGLVGGADILDILSGRKSDTILSVNGEEVSYDQFQRFYNNELEAFRQKNNDREPQGYQLQQLENQVWESIVIEILKRQMVEKMGLRTSNDEIRYFIFTNPHAIFRMDQNFWNEKNEFDPEKFQSALSSPGNDQFWRYKEEYLRMYLPYEKLDEEIISTVRITDEELREEYATKNQKVKVSYLFFDPNKYPVSDDGITEKEIKDYYKEHTDEFKEEETRKINYVLFSIDPSASDSSETYTFAETLLDSARQGANFAEMAETYSDDPGSAVKGGDLGFFGKGAMVKPFEEAAFAASVGDIIGPVKSNFGLHIIKVEAKKVENGEEQVQARHVLLKFKASRSTQEAARDNANYFAEIAKEEGFSQTTATEKLKVDTTGYFRNTGFIPKLGLQKRMVTAAFSYKVGQVSKVFYIEDKGYLAFEVSGIKETGILPLDDVQARIKSTLRREKQLQKAEQDAQKVREKIHLPEDFEAVAAADSLEIKETDFFTLDGNISGVGRSPEFNGGAFALGKKEISKPVKTTRGYYIIRQEDKEPFDENGFNSQKETLKRQLLDTKRRTTYNNWLASLKEQAEIKDYRHLFF